MKNVKKTLSVLLALVLVLSLCLSAAFAAPPAAPAKESDDYTGPVVDYPDKELWFKSDIYGGFYSAYQIVRGNGDDSFDIDAFINSKQGELILSRVKYELCLLGDRAWASQEMIDYWAGRGIMEHVYNQDDPANEWLAYVPEYMVAEDNTEVYPVVFSFHGGGGTLFEATNHGFVDICYEEGFMVVVPENNGMDAQTCVASIDLYLSELEAKGFPVDRSRVYVTGHSMGGVMSMYTGLMNDDTVAAIAAHSSVRMFSFDGELYTPLKDSTLAALESDKEIPAYIQVGGCDMNHLPFSQTVIDGMNQWLEMNDCSPVTASSGNALGITGDEVYTAELDGTTYTFSRNYNSDNEPTMIFAGVEGLPHWISYSFSKLAWDFMSQYSIVDGQRIYTEKTPTYYSDVDNDADCASAVQAVTEAGLMKGVDVNTFAPKGTVTRAQVVTVLGRLANAVPTDICGVSDVAAGSWYSGYVGWAVANGIVTLEDGKFDPNGTLTGTELDEILTAYAELTGVDYINFPNNNNTVSFGPTGPVSTPSTEPVTRSELAVRLNKLMNAPVDYDYEDKELWFKTDLYGGFYSPYQIFMGNGDASFDMPAFVNSKHGEQMMSRIKYELALLGDKNWSAPEMIEYWANKGVTQKAYNVGTTTEWLAYIPDYITTSGNESWPVVFCFHGGGGTLFESTNHGFVDLCYEQGFIVIVPENENTNNQLSLAGLTDYVAVLESEGYKIDHDRIYTSGMSMGGMASMYCAVKGADIVAASTAQGCAGYGLLFGEDSKYENYLTLADFEKATEEAPMYFLVGDHEMAHQIPLTDGALTGLNTWLKMNGCHTAERADNVLGFTADRIYEMEIDGTTYTFAEFFNGEGEVSVVFVGIEDWVHWTPYSYARLSWNFMSQYTNQ